VRAEDPRRSAEVSAPSNAPAKSSGRVLTEEDLIKRGLPRTMPPPPPGFVAPGTKVYGVQDPGVDVQGVAFVDQAGRDSDGAGRVALLVAGDVAALVLFAAIGRGSHHETVASLETLGTALPFVLGWLGSCAWLDGYGKAARGWEAVPAAAKAAQCWAVGIPAGLAIRGLLQMRVPPTPFIAVSMAVTFALLVSWRAALAAATEDPRTPASVKRAMEENRRARSKKGNIFDLVKVIGGLTGRW